MISLTSIAIGELVTPVQSWTPERDAPDKPFRYIDLSAVDQETKQIIADRPVLGADAPSRARQIVAADDVLVSTVRPNLNGVARVPSEMHGATASTGFCVLRPRPAKLDSAYLFHWVRSPQFVAEMVRRATGASYPAVSDRIVLESSMPLPPLSEQRRIAEVLDRTEALRAKRRAALGQLDTLAQAILLDMFGDPSTNPMGWPVRQIGDVMSEVYRYPSYYDITYMENGIPEIRGELLQDDGSIVTDRNRLRYIAPRTSARFPRTVLQEGDLVMSVRGTIGKIGLVPPSLAGANMTANLIRMAPDRRILNSSFAWHLAHTDWFKGQLAKASSSTTILTIKASDLKRLRIPLPPLADQQRFANLCNGVGSLKDACRASLASLDVLFASLQHCAFQGDL